MRKLPGKRDYANFVENFRAGLEANYPDVCFFIYGSYREGDLVPGLSDIDGGLIMNSGVVTDKEKVIGLADLMAASLNGFYVKPQFNLIDTRVARDGRFLSYARDYTDYVKRASHIVSGPDYVSQLNGLDFKSSPLSMAAFNLCGPNGVRNALLYHRYLEQTSSEYFEETVIGALRKAAKFPGRVISLIDGGINRSRPAARARIEEVLGVNLDALKEVDYFLVDAQKMQGVFDQPGKPARLVSDSLGCMESIVEAYLGKYPLVRPNECRE